jgi:hypothetical protein
VLAADPYHLDRMAQIERLGTLAYDLAAEPKVNSFSWAYELVLADIHQIPYVGGVLLRLHGLFGIAIYLLALSAARTWLRRSKPDRNRLRRQTRPARRQPVRRASRMSRPARRKLTWPVASCSQTIRSPASLARCMARCAARVTDSRCTRVGLALPRTLNARRAS